MTKNVNFLILFLFILLTGSFMHADISLKIEDYEKYVNEIINQFEKEMKQEYGFRCIGSGGSMPHDVESIDVKFTMYKRATIEEARELVVMATRKLQRIVNTHEKIRPYLREYPFSSKRVEISLSFCKKNHEQYTDGSVAYVLHTFNIPYERNLICYCAEDTQIDDLVDLLDESYEEAEKIVDNKNIQKENSQL